jgi:hypothetical protein
MIMGMKKIDECLQIDSHYWNYYFLPHLGLLYVVILYSIEFLA